MGPTVRQPPIYLRSIVRSLILVQSYGISMRVDALRILPDLTGFADSNYGLELLADW